MGILLLGPFDLSLWLCGRTGGGARAWGAADVATSIPRQRIITRKMMGLVESPGNTTSTRGSGAMGMIELLRRRARGTERHGDTRPY